MGTSRVEELLASDKSPKQIAREIANSVTENSSPMGSHPFEAHHGVLTGQGFVHKSTKPGKDEFSLEHRYEHPMTGHSVTLHEGLIRVVHEDSKGSKSSGRAGVNFTNPDTLDYHLTRNK